MNRVPYVRKYFAGVLFCCNSSRFPFAYRIVFSVNRKETADIKFGFGRF